MTGLRIASQSRFFAGCAFTALGVAGLAIAQGYPLGTAARMGPGFFPVVLSALLIFLGLLSCVAGLRTPTTDQVRGWPLLPMALILGGVVGFGLLIEPAGLLAAAGLLLACIFSPRFRSRPIEALVLGVGLIGFVSLLFVYGLGLPIALY